MPQYSTFQYNTVINMSVTSEEHGSFLGHFLVISWSFLWYDLDCHQYPGYRKLAQMGRPEAWDREEEASKENLQAEEDASDEVLVDVSNDK